MTHEIPDKLYFKIGEVSKLAEVAPHVLRYWESEFDSIQPKRAGSKQRLYRREDLEMILVIKDLLHGQGYTIAGARKLIAEAKNLAEIGPEPPAAPGEDSKSESKLTSELGAIKEELIKLKDILSRKR